MGRIGANTAFALSHTWPAWSVVGAEDCQSCFACLCKSDLDPEPFRSYTWGIRMYGRISHRAGFTEEAHH